MGSDLFYKYYDALFTAKDYQKETDTILEVATKYGINHIDNLLEIGCGTGSHTIGLAKKVGRITAVDTDEKMIERSSIRLKSTNTNNVELFYGNSADLDQKGFDVAVAMFNVVTYIPDEGTLVDLFSSVYERLKDGGIFVFDCWNGIAALLDPPGSKETKVKVDGDEVYCLLTSETNFIEQRTILTYDLKVKKADGTLEEGKMSFGQTLWTPMQIRAALKTSGLKELHFSKHLQVGTLATEKDWKVMFVCGKND